MRLPWFTRGIHENDILQTMDWKSDRHHIWSLKEMIRFGVFFYKRYSFRIFRVYSMTLSWKIKFWNRNYENDRLTLNRMEWLFKKLFIILLWYFLKVSDWTISPYFIHSINFFISKGWNSKICKWLFQPNIFFMYLRKDKYLSSFMAYTFSKIYIQISKIWQGYTAW